MMKAKLYITRAAKITAFLLLAAVVIGLLQEYVLCNHDANRLRLDGFYIEDKDTIDVAMIGSSEMYSGISPALLYEQYGFTSYPYATASSTAAAMKTQIKEVERTQSPKLFVIEINCFLYATENESKESSIRNYIDNVPLNLNKAEYIVQTPALDQFDRMEFFFPIIKYHSVWNDFPAPYGKMVSRISQDQRGYTLLKGYKTTAQVFKPKEEIYNPKLPADETRRDIEPAYEVYLREFLDYCKEQQYDNLLFVRFPHIVTKQTYNRFARGNRAFDIIHDYGFRYINFERDMNAMSYGTEDYYNNDHLNIYGSVKFTDYFGKILSEKYNIEKCQLSDEEQRQWNEAVDFWHEFYAYTDYRFKNNTKNKKIELYETNDVIKKVKDFTAANKGS